VGADVVVYPVRNVEAPRDLAGQALRRLDVSLHVEVIPQVGLAECEVGRGSSIRLSASGLRSTRVKRATPSGSSNEPSA